MKELANIPKTSKKRIVIVGGGFAGTQLVKRLLKSPFQIVLIDKNNYYQFQPLYYQVAIGGLEPSAICFPFRRRFQGKKYNFHFRLCSIQRINPSEKNIETSIGCIHYDYLVLATGVTTNFFGNEQIEKNAVTMKSVSEAIWARNSILENFEKAITCDNEEERQQYLNIAIVGGGPAGVELAGALAEMKKYILPKDFPDADFQSTQIIIYEGQPNVLPTMSQKSSNAAMKYLGKLSVDVKTNIIVKDYDGETATLSDGNTIKTRNLIWTAGVVGKKLEGLDDSIYGHANRIITDEFNKVKGYSSLYAIGDISIMETEDYPNGHPQMAQVAMQQATLLAENLVLQLNGKEQKSFEYYNKGSMATIGRNLAVADLRRINLKGFWAWFLFSTVHLLSIMGLKNKLFVLLDWISSYFTYDPSLRLLIKPRLPRDK